MKRKIKVIILTVLLVILLLALAPWMDNKDIHDQVLRERGKIDGTINKDEDLICDYKVMWFPFGRYVASCEGGWYVTFYGKIL